MGIAVVEPPVSVAGHDVAVAVLYVPLAEVATQVAGTLLAEVSPHGAGTTASRRLTADKNAA